MFVFTVTNFSAQELNLPYQSDTAISCFCVWLHDLQLIQGELYKVQKAICVCTVNP